MNVFVDEGGIKTMKEVMKHHNSNPAVIKEVTRTLKNVAKTDPNYSHQIAKEGICRQ